MNVVRKIINETGVQFVEIMMSVESSWDLDRVAISPDYHHLIALDMQKWLGCKS